MIGTKLNNEGHFNLWLLSHKDVMRLPHLAPPESYPVWLVQTFAEFTDGQCVVGVIYLYPMDLREMLGSLEPDKTIETCPLCNCKKCQCDVATEQIEFEPVRLRAIDACIECLQYNGHTPGCKYYRVTDGK